MIPTIEPNKKRQSVTDAFRNTTRYPLHHLAFID